MYNKSAIPRVHILAAALLVAAAFILRIWIARDAFWLDEIWSYNLTKIINSPIQVLTDLKIDNNHLLNTWYMYLIGEQANWFTYRIPSLLSGTATVALMGLAAIRLGNRPWLTLLFGTLSLPLVQYSAEARGYGLAACLGVMAWYIFCFKLQPTSLFRWVILFWTVCAVGFLAHLSFAFIFISLGTAWAAHLFFNEKVTQSSITRGLTIFLPPGIFLIWLYAVFYSQLSVGGGQTTVLITSSLLQLGQSLLGAPINTISSLIACGIILFLCGFGLARLEKYQQYFFVSALLIVPGILLTAFSPDFFYPRYVLTCVPFIYILISHALEPWFRSTGAIRLASSALLLLVLAGNSLQLFNLARWGKGDYPAAIESLYANADNQEFTVGGDFDFRHKALIDFYTRYRSDAALLVYIENAHTATSPTDFFILHDRKPEPGTKQYVRLENGGTYKVIGIYPYSGLSGWNWYVYSHIQEPPPG